MVCACDSVPLQRLLVSGDPCRVAAAVQRLQHLTHPVTVYRHGYVPSDSGRRDIRVLQCYPCTSGHITRSTQVVVIPKSLYDRRLSTLSRLLTQLSYTMCLLLPAASSVSVMVFTCVMLLRHWYRTQPLRLYPVSRGTMHRLCLSAVQMDYHSTVIVNWQTLWYLGVRSGSWCLCSIESCHGITCSHVYVRLVGSRHVDHTCTALVSTSLWHVTARDMPSRMYVRVRKSAVRPTVAHSVRLAQVAAPSSLSLQQCQHLLTSYFDRVRLLVREHILMVPVAACWSDDRHAQFAFFRVESLSARRQDGDISGGQLFQPGVTSLFQVSDVTAAVPSCLPVLDTPWEPGIQPTGLESACDELVAAFSGSSCSGSLVAFCGSASWALEEVAAAVAARLGCHLQLVSCQQLVADSPGASCARLRQRLLGGKGRCLLVLRHTQLLARDRDTGRVDRRQLDALLETAAALPADCRLLLTAPAPHQLVVELRTHLTHVLQLPLRVAGLLSWLARRQGLLVDGEPDDCSCAELPQLLQLARLSCVRRFEASSCCRVLPPEQLLDAVDLRAGEQMLSQRRVAAPSIPDTRWQDVGGLTDVKQTVVDTVQLPLTHARLLGPTSAAAGLSRCGLLLYGPPGTGKTLLARAVATECNIGFISVKGPELIDMYVGQSEANLRDVFGRALDAAPCIVFFDELDSLAPSRGKTGDSGGVMDRVVSQFLTELDRAATCQVFVMAATNRPDLVDPALLRPGRFDKLLYLPPASTRHQQLNILHAQTRRLQLADDVDLEAVVEHLPETVTGADMFSVCEQATRLALQRAISLIQSGEASEETASLEIRQQFLLEAAQNTEPSISRQELNRYEELRRTINYTG